MQNNVKAIALSKEAILTSVLVGASALAPLMHSQLVTGSIVNAALFVAAAALGIRGVAMVAVIPSLIALSVGTLPVMMAPMVPFIMAANIALGGVFVLLQRTNYWFAGIVASLAKFAVLVICANVVLAAVTHGKMAAALASMMGWPQLVTALIGCGIAYGVVKMKKITN